MKLAGKALWPTLAGLAGAAFASFALAGRVPAADALRGTLLLLPFLVWAFDGLARLAGARRGRMVGLALAAGWLLLALLRTHLGLLGADGVLMALYFGFWLLAIARLLPALRRQLGHQIPLRPHVLFFLLPLFF